jgi:multimeric flavodoxin WrbA
MKVLGVSGGHKNGTNDAMIKEALMGAKEAGAEIEFIRLLDLSLKPCTGCCFCVTGNDGTTQGGSGKCVLKDDFEWFENKFLDADGIIFSLPVFEEGVPGVFKMIQDRLGGPSHDLGMLTVSNHIRQQKGAAAPPKGPDPRELSPKVVAGIAIGGSDWTSRAEGDFKLFAMSGAHKVIDTLVFSWGKSIIVDDKRVAQIHELGQKVAEAVKNPELAHYQGESGICPSCHTHLLCINEDANKCRCSVCGVTGELKIIDGKITFLVSPEGMTHAHTTMSGKMEHMDDIGKLEGAFAEIKNGDEYKKRIKKYNDFITPTLPPRGV